MTLSTKYRIDPETHPLDWAKCGTPANYQAHLRRGEKPCEACRKAQNRDRVDRAATQELRRKQEEYRRYRVRTVRKGDVPMSYEAWSTLLPWVKDFRKMIRQVNRNLRTKGSVI